MATLTLSKPVVLKPELVALLEKTRPAPPPLPIVTNDAPTDPELSGKERKRRRIRWVEMQLRHLAPRLFNGSRQPMAVGVREEIVAKWPVVDPAALRLFLRLWAVHPRYLKAMADGAVRRDLDGAEAGEITPEQREWAATFLVNLEIQKAERAAQKETAGTGPAAT